MVVAAHRFGSAAFIDCKPPLFRGEGDRVSGGRVSDGIPRERPGIPDHTVGATSARAPHRPPALLSSLLDGVEPTLPQQSLFLIVLFSFYLTRSKGYG